jgi:hypothetical protein
LQSSHREGYQSGDRGRHSRESHVSRLDLVPPIAEACLLARFFRMILYGQRRWGGSRATEVLF